MSTRAFTGRCNLFADTAGVLVVDRDADRRDSTASTEAITLATLRPTSRWSNGEMLATVKIIPFAVLGRRLHVGDEDRAAGQAAGAGRALYDQEGRRRLDDAAGLVAEGDRQDAARSPTSASLRRRAHHWPRRRVPHEQRGARQGASDEVLKAGAELVIVFGASAIADRRDVIPAAIEAVGGKIEHFGMPVDPGNLMLIGSANGTPGAGRAGLRALAEGKRFRLGAGAAARRPAGDARRHHRHGRRRPADGDRHAAAAARGTRRAERRTHRGC